MCIVARKKYSMFVRIGSGSILVGDTAKRLGVPKSQIVTNGITLYHRFYRISGIYVLVNLLYTRSWDSRS